MKVDINYVKYLREELGKINRLDIGDIEWYNGEEKIEVDPKHLKHWRFVGLNNTDFATMEFWKEPVDQEFDEWLDKVDKGTNG
jgi:hypothetical protein